jgi:hypothetical protein
LTASLSTRKRTRQPRLPVLGQWRPPNTITRGHLMALLSVPPSRGKRCLLSLSQHDHNSPCLHQHASPHPAPAPQALVGKTAGPIMGVVSGWTPRQSRRPRLHHVLSASCKRSRQPPLPQATAPSHRIFCQRTSADVLKCSRQVSSLVTTY